MISARGRGAVRIAPAAPEYWIASSNPETDQPLRHPALTQADGDAWEALGLLCDADWHDASTPHAARPRSMTATATAPCQRRADPARRRRDDGGAASPRG